MGTLLFILIFHPKLTTSSDVKRYWHTATCVSLDPTKLQVVVFGGREETGQHPEPMSNTTVFCLGALQYSQCNFAQGTNILV